MWQQWINAVLGLAVIATPFLGLASATLVWTLVVLGAVIVVLGVWGAVQESSPGRELRHS